MTQMERCSQRQLNKLQLQVQRLIMFLFSEHKNFFTWSHSCQPRNLTKHLRHFQANWEFFGSFYFLKNVEKNFETFEIKLSNYFILIKTFFDSKLKTTEFLLIFRRRHFLWVEPSENEEFVIRTGKKYFPGIREKF